MTYKQEKYIKISDCINYFGDPSRNTIEGNVNNLSFRIAVLKGD